MRRWTDVRVVQGVGGAAAMNHVFNCVKYCVGMLVVVMHEGLGGGSSSSEGSLSTTSSSSTAAWFVAACVGIAYAFWYVGG